MHKSKPASRWKQEVKAMDSFVKDPETSDLVIAVMGRTGVGKSTFINTLLGKKVAPVGHDILSETSQVMHYEFSHPQHLERRILLVDTPGFDDSGVPEQEILRRIAVWLARSYEARMKLAGVVYLHDISSSRINGSEKKVYRAFEKLCGREGATKVILATSKWDKLDNVEEGEIREKRLIEVFWNDMFENGSSIHRLQLSQESAQEIIDSILSHGFANYIAIQKEMVDYDKKLIETAAFRHLRGAAGPEEQSTWAKVSERFKKWVA